MNNKNANELLNKIDKNYEQMSKGQKLLADYILKNYDKAVFLTAAKLGKVVGVSESTVVRFATQLGYQGYPGFQKALEELVRNKLNSIQRMEVTYGRISQSEILASVLQSDIEKIKLTLANMDQNAFELAVDTILNAKRIYVVGIRSCAPLANFLSFYLNLIFDNVTSVHTNSSSEIFEQLIRIGVGGCDYRHQFSAIFNAYVEGAGICEQPESKGDHTDRQCTFSNDIIFILQSDCEKRYGIYCRFAGCSVKCCERTCGGIMHEKKQKDVIATLETLEQIWDEYQVYSSDELNQVDDSVSLNFKENEET